MLKVSESRRRFQGERAETEPLESPDLLPLERPLCGAIRGHMSRLGEQRKAKSRHDVRRIKAPAP